MNTLSHKSCLMIKLSYVLLSSGLLFNFIRQSHALSFKFIISSIGILTFFSLFICSVLQKGFSLVYSGIIVFGLLYILNLIFIVI